MQGKTIADAKGDIFRGIEVVEFACGVAPMTMGETIENVSRGMDTYSYRSCAAEVSAVILCGIVSGGGGGNSERRMGGVCGVCLLGLCVYALFCSGGCFHHLHMLPPFMFHPQVVAVHVFVSVFVFVNV